MLAITASSKEIIYEGRYYMIVGQMIVGQKAGEAIADNKEKMVYYLKKSQNSDFENELDTYLMVMD